MALRARIEPISDWIQIAADRSLSRQARQEAIAEFAGEQLAGARDANQRILGRVPPNTTHVDGRAEAPLTSVNPDKGIIVFEFELVADVLRWIMQTLVDRSPIVSGAYRNSHMIFADGAAIRLTDTVPKAAEYVVLNAQPYARKIEIGKTKSGRAFVIQVEPRIYERTAKDAASRFGNIAKIRFGYSAPLGGATALESWASTTRQTRRGSSLSVEAWNRRQPAIFIWTD